MFWLIRMVKLQWTIMKCVSSTKSLCLVSLVLKKINRLIYFNSTTKVLGSFASFDEEDNLWGWRYLHLYSSYSIVITFRRRKNKVISLTLQWKSINLRRPSSPSVNEVIWREVNWNIIWYLSVKFEYNLIAMILICLIRFFSKLSIWGGLWWQVLWSSKR